MSEKTFEDVVREVAGKKILVANRGIPARRVIRTIREQFKAISILTVTDVDKSSPTTAGAGQLLLLGARPSAYLDLPLVIKGAKERGVAALHPGWGFGSEDCNFPILCKEAGIIFIGPTAEAMRMLGNKVEVRGLAKRLGVPVVPGSEGAVSIPEAREEAKKIGFPIMLKAEGGGGGRGIYEVYRPEQLEEAFVKASSQAQAAFGNPRLYVEKLLTNVRHIEIQVIADKHGNVFAFDERDCTVQRNHQKLIEITPSPWPGMTEELRERLKEWSVKLVKDVGYHSLATVEFLLDGSATPYLIEVNTRLQVEHGITECRYGVDLVEEQIAVAFGSRLRFNKENTKPYQMAMQVRINCEDPRNNFTPNAGLITRYISPGGQGIRLDSCISSGYDFPAQYDSAGALLIAHGKEWPKVVAIMDRALREYLIGGVKTTIPFHCQVLRNKKFIDADYDTKFVENTPELLDYRDEEQEALRLSQLAAEISAKGFNPHVMLGRYRNRGDKRVGRFTPHLPRLDTDSWKSPYPLGDRAALLDYIRGSGQIHFTDTTSRDITQSNTGNRFRLAEDRIVGPYLDNCGFFALENGGGAHFHVAMMANMTYPFTEAKEWNRFAPKTPKMILIRSTNVLGYKPQPQNLMRLTGEMICEHYDVVRCFDFLNHIENMEPFAEVALSHPRNIFQPAISLSQAKGFDVDHYLGVTKEIIAMCARAAGLSETKVSRIIMLCFKDMAGMCKPSFIRALVTAVREKYPELVLEYHRHFTDGLWTPAVAAAAQAGCHVLDAAIGSSVRWYGHGDVLSTAAYLEELGLETSLNKEMLSDCGFVLKQIMPYFDRYMSPYFQGIDYEVVEHGMPGGATSSSQEGALKQGYIHLLPYMLKFLAGTRKIVRYHDVTPGSQITWNTAFLAVTGAYKRGGERAVKDLLGILNTVVNTPEHELTKAERHDRLAIYADSNDAFRNLLLGNYGRMPLGFPPDWVYESAFGPEYQTAVAKRTEKSPLAFLHDVDMEAEAAALKKRLDRQPTDEEFVMYLNHPGDALKTIDFVAKYGDPNNLPLDVWLEGLEPGQELAFNDSLGKAHVMNMVHVSRPDAHGFATVRYILDSESLSHQIKVGEPAAGAGTGIEMAQPDNPYQVGAPCNGDLWVMQVRPGDFVKVGEELFNISVMKQEKSVLSPVDGVVKRVLKDANYHEDKKMVPVKENELLIELGPVERTCDGCGQPQSGDFQYCPYCGCKSD